MCRKLQKSSRYSCGVAIACASFVGFTIYRPVGSTCAKWILEIVFAVSFPPTTWPKSMLWVIQAFGYSHMQSKTLNYSWKKWGPWLFWLKVLKYISEREIHGHHSRESVNTAPLDDLSTSACCCEVRANKYGPNCDRYACDTLPLGR